MPEGPRLDPKVLRDQQNIDNQLIDNLEVKMRKDSTVQLYNNNNNVLNSSIESGDFKVSDRPTRGSIRNVLSGKKVSFCDGLSKAKGSTNQPDTFEVEDPTQHSNKQVTVKRTQSQRETKSYSTIGQDQYKYKPKRCASFRESLRQGESYQVLMLGAVGVGKSSLVQQFQESNNGHVSVKVSNVYGGKIFLTSL